MGTSNNIKDSNITSKLMDLTCEKCSQQFTKEDIEEENFDFYFDTSNDVKLEKLSKGYSFSIWVRSIEHKDCPDIIENNE